MNQMPVRFINGTHRLIPPEETLELIKPKLHLCGITRLADITGLDTNMGVPIYSAVRPGARLLQVSAGKGLTRAASKVSALMEAIELFHAEEAVVSRFVSNHRSAMEKQGLETDPLPEMIAHSKRFFSDSLVTDWIEAENLQTGAQVWLPAGAVYFHEPSPVRANTNGLASGNHMVEASLHGLYELIERDTISGLSHEGRLHIERDCHILDPANLPWPHLSDLVQKILDANNQLVLLRVVSGLSLPVFWAILLNTAPYSLFSGLNAGSGAHLDPAVAASRAITEAVQSRLSMIQGTREDIVDKGVFNSQVQGRGAAYRYFAGLTPNTTPLNQSDVCYNLHNALAQILSMLKKAGHERVYRVVLTRPEINIPVVKIVAPSLRFDHLLF